MKTACNRAQWRILQHGSWMLLALTLWGAAWLWCTTVAGADGERAWSRITGSVDSEFGMDIARDAAGNVYVCGQTDGAFGGQTNAGMTDACLVKYDSNGLQLWVRIWGSANYDGAAGVAVDAAGNVYVSGSTKGAFDGQSGHPGSWDCFLTKFNASGTRQWSSIWGSDDDEAGRDVCVDPAGYIYVCGRTDGAFDGQTNTSYGHYDLCLKKFYTAGGTMWSRIWGSVGDDDAIGVQADTGGYIFVCGSADGTIDGFPVAGGLDLYLAKYTGSGTREWSRIRGSTANDEAFGVSVDRNNGVIIAGYAMAAFDGQTFQGDLDMVLCKYSGAGHLIVTRMWGSVAYDIALSVCCDDERAIYVGGSTRASAIDDQTNPGSEGAVLSKFDPDTYNRTWLRIWGADNASDARGVCAAPDNVVYAGGSTRGAGFDGQTSKGAFDLYLSQFIAAQPWLDITNAPATLAASTATLSGTNNQWLSFGQTMWWHNNANDRQGAIVANASQAWLANDVVLADGPNLLVVHATNGYGKSAQDSVTFTYIAPPFVDITNGNCTVEEPASTASIGGTNNVSIAPGDSIWWDNLAAGVSGAQPADASRGWTIADIALAAGDNTIAVHGSNAFGAVASDSIVVTLVPEPLLIACGAFVLMGCWLRGKWPQP